MCASRKVAVVAHSTPNASTASGRIRPLGIGRSRVRDIRSSMSRSMYMLTALAPPAMRYPPMNTATTSCQLGLPATYIGAIVVTSSSEMMRGFVSASRSRANDWRAVFAAAAWVMARDA